MQGKLVLDIDPYNSRYTAIKQPITKQCHMIIDCHDMTYEPVHEISNIVVCATSKASDQPAHTRSLIRAFASRLSFLQLFSY